MCDISQSQSLNKKSLYWIWMLPEDNLLSVTDVTTQN